MHAERTGQAHRPFENSGCRQSTMFGFMSLFTGGGEASSSTQEAENPTKNAAKKSAPSPRQPLVLRERHTPWFEVQRNIKANQQPAARSQHPREHSPRKRPHMGGNGLGSARTLYMSPLPDGHSPLPARCKSASEVAPTSVQTSIATEILRQKQMRAGKSASEVAPPSVAPVAHLDGVVEQQTTIAAEILRQKQLRAIRKTDGESATNLHAYSATPSQANSPQLFAHPLAHVGDPRRAALMDLLSDHERACVENAVDTCNTARAIAAERARAYAAKMRVGREVKRREDAPRRNVPQSVRDKAAAIRMAHARGGLARTRGGLAVAARAGKDEDGRTWLRGPDGKMLARDEDGGWLLQGANGEVDAADEATVERFRVMHSAIATRDAQRRGDSSPVLQKPSPSLPHTPSAGTPSVASAASESSASDQSASEASPSLPSEGTATTPSRPPMVSPLQTSRTRNISLMSTPRSGSTSERQLVVLTPRGSRAGRRSVTPRGSALPTPRQLEDVAVKDENGDMWLDGLYGECLFKLADTDEWIAQSRDGARKPADEATLAAYRSLRIPPKPPLIPFSSPRTPRWHLGTPRTPKASTTPRSARSVSREEEARLHRFRERDRHAEEVRQRARRIAAEGHRATVAYV